MPKIMGHGDLYTALMGKLQSLFLLSTVVPPFGWGKNQLKLFVAPGTAVSGCPVGTHRVCSKDGDWVSNSL